MSGPARGRRGRVTPLRAVSAVPCAARLYLPPRPAPKRSPPTCSVRCTDGFVAPQDSPLRKTSGAAIDRPDPIDPVDDERLRAGQAGAVADRQDSDLWYSARSRRRRRRLRFAQPQAQKPKPNPGQPKPKPSPGPGSPAPADLDATVGTRWAGAPGYPAVRDREPAPDRAGGGRHGGRSAAAQAAEPR